MQRDQPPMSRASIAALAAAGLPSWGARMVNLGVVDEIASPDMLLKHSLHETPAKLLW